MEKKEVKFIGKEERVKLALERRAAQVASARSQKPADSSKLEITKNIITPENESELMAIRNRYMNVDREPKHKRVKRMDDKKFVFDWDTKEDTSSSQKIHSAVFFGRGMIAGIDQLVQKESSTKYYHSQPSNGEPTQVSNRFDERHWKEKPLAQMSQRDWRIFREDFTISTQGGNVPNPIRTWEESGLPLKILQVIKKIGYVEPTPIQRQAIPIQILNRDVIGVASTGSGKTASFVIPMLVFISMLPPITYENASQGPYGLIMAPTRELAQQIETEATKFAKAMEYICVSLVGGHKIEDQSFNLRDGVHIIIATPGRLRDCIDRRIVALNQCTYIVMDEADKMMEMGCGDDLMYILNAMPLSNIKPDSEDAENVLRLKEMTGRKLPFRQTVMFSATMPAEVERIAKAYLRRPATVIAGQAIDTIEQRVEFIDDEARRLNRLVSILSSREFRPPMIVFVNRKQGCDSVTRALEKAGVKCATLHGGKSQDQRESALAGLKSGSKDVMVATDVAGRGIDIKDVSLVVNFDMANTIEGYTHRIGRTGRAGRKGVSITFLSNHDAEVLFDLRKYIEKSKCSHVPRELERHEFAQRKYEASGRKERNIE